jgi:hypothetical protein
MEGRGYGLIMEYKRNLAGRCYCLMQALSLNFVGKTEQNTKISVTIEGA